MSGTQDAKTLILLAGAQLGKTKEQLEAVIKSVVNDNWIESKESLLALTPDQVISLGIPLNLWNQISKIIKSDQSATGETQDLAKSVNSEDVSTKFEVNYDEFFDEESLHAAYQNFKESVNLFESKEQYIATLRTLLHILNETISKPQDPSRRVLRLKNETFQTRINNFPCAISILSNVGFEVNSQNVILYVACIPKLLKASRLLGALFTELTGEFFPQTNLGENGTDFNSIKEEIDQLNTKLKTGGSDKPVPLNPKIFHRSELVCSSEPINEAQRAEDEARLISEYCSRIREAAALSEQFRSRTVEHLKQLKQQTMYSTCIVRVQFPDNYILQLEFAPNTTLQEVKNAISQFINEDIVNCKWHLFDTPPMRKLINLNRTLYDEQLVPACFVRFAFDSGQWLPCNINHYLKDVQN